MTFPHDTRECLKRRVHRLTRHPRATHDARLRSHYSLSPTPAAHGDKTRPGWRSWTAPNNHGAATTHERERAKFAPIAWPTRLSACRVRVSVYLCRQWLTVSVG